MAVTTEPRVKLAGYWRAEPRRGRASSWYDDWIQSTGVPIYEGNHVDDLRTIDLGPWEERECDTAFLQLDGQKGIVDLRVTEIPPGATLPPVKMLLDEKVYVLQGQGLTTLWAGDGPKRTFEWQTHSLFFVPPNYTYQLSNARGNQPARLVHSNRLDIAASIIPNPEVFFNNPIVDMGILYGEEDIFSEAKVVAGNEMGEYRRQFVWAGNFFPDVTAWEKLEPHRTRGAGGHTVVFGAKHGGAAGTRASMSVFPARTYKKAHRHGPGFIIVIPKGEGFSVMWEPGSDDILFCPWHEGSLVVPPNQWFHQHFNLGSEPARYLKISGHLPATGMMRGATIEYPDENPWIRQRFEEELAKRGLTSLMPPECYADRDYQWPYGQDMSGE